MKTATVKVDLGNHAYDVSIGAGLLERVAEFVPFDLSGRSFFLITDENIRHFALKVSSGLMQGGAGRVETFVVAPGESSKCFERVVAISEWMIENGAHRDSCVIAVGGGVVGDLAGFCASIVMRGIPYIQIPTTLLSQVDSSVGGKTGINLSQGKNMVGTFYQPQAVIADIEALNTLPRREFLSGYAEIVKCALIQDAEFFKWLEQAGQDICTQEPEALIHAIEESVKIKAAIVMADERESGQRMLLNLGHTGGHALETASAYDGRVLHGEAVAIGTVMAFELSHRLGYCAADDVRRVDAHFADIGLPVRIAAIQPALKSSPKELIEIMGRDKKATGGKLRFVAARAIGDCFITGGVAEDMIADVLQWSMDGR